MEVTEDTPERIKSASKTDATLREFGITDVYSSLDEFSDDDSNINNSATSVTSPKKYASPYKPSGTDGSGHHPPASIIITPERINRNAPAPATARDLYSKTPPRPSSPVRRPTTAPRVPSTVTPARKTPKQAAKKAPLEKIVGDKRRAISKLPDPLHYFIF